MLPDILPLILIRPYSEQKPNLAKSHTLTVTLTNLEGDPKRIELVDDRLYTLRQLARKHGIVLTSFPKRDGASTV